MVYVVNDMSKPLGLTPAFHVTMPSKTEDRIWDAVEEAIEAGWTPVRFKHEVAAAWEAILKKAAKDAIRVLNSY